MAIEATDIRLGTISQSQQLYFTGGLRAEPQQNGGFALGPVDSSDSELIYYLVSWPEVIEMTQAGGSAFVGVNQTYNDGSPGRTEVWRPVVPFSSQQLHASDSWSALSHQARAKKDDRFSDIARYLSVCIHAAGVRLRDVARAHHEQLGWALRGRKKLGARFSNMAMTDVHLAFHSLAGELCAARDHLAHVAAIGCGAKDTVDSMARLEEWLSKPANIAMRANPLASLLALAMGTRDKQGWLRLLGDLRNTMMHRQPMGGDPGAGALCVFETPTRKGPISTIRLVPMTGTVRYADPFRDLAEFYNQFEMLAIRASAHVPYAVELPLVVGK